MPKTGENALATLLCGADLRPSESPREISLYFHIPFCAKKCPYCHFFVLPDKEALKTELLGALALEWKRNLPYLVGKQIVSIYFGGGTPTRLSPDAFATILEWIAQGPAPIDKECEITLEANPDDISAPLMQTFAALGINRVSLGVQSLDDSHLSLLGRRHSATRAIDAVHTVAQSGISNISIDLMYDLPEQTLDSWKRTLLAVEHLPITHLSLYNLTFEPHTAFFRKKQQLTPLLPTPELSLQLLNEAVQFLTQTAWTRYEISAFAKQGARSKHNCGYWTARPFLGYGPSAFSYWDKKRFRNVAHLKSYAQALQDNRSPVDFTEQLPFPDNLKELLAVELRLLDGVNLHTFQARHGILPPDLLATLQELHTKGWLSLDKDRASLTKQGLLFYDSLAETII
jgi:oxygen-independent coproporphyrinogen-3 oxidase